MVQNISPIQILKKHIQSNPKISIAISITERGELSGDISAPGTIGDVLLMQKCLERQVNIMMDQMASGESK